MGCTRNEVMVGNLWFGKLLTSTLLVTETGGFRLTGAEYVFFAFDKGLLRPFLGPPLLFFLLSEIISPTLGLLSQELKESGTIYVYI